MTNTANVTDNPITVIGILNPASDSGKNNQDDITNVAAELLWHGLVVATTNIPEPFAHVTLFANGVAVGNDPGRQRWDVVDHLEPAGPRNLHDHRQRDRSIRPDCLTDGHDFVPTLVVDTAPPVITSLSFDRFDATLTVTFQDNLSGMDLASLTNSAFYHISARPLSSKVHVPTLILPTSISFTRRAPCPAIRWWSTWSSTRAMPFRGGKYEVIINSGTGDTGIQDVAGNALDGNFYGAFPTGDGLAGGNFVADILTFHNKVLPFVPIADGYVPPAAGIDPPAGALHSGAIGKLKARHKAHETVVARHHAAVSTRVHDAALRAHVNASERHHS